SSSELPQLSLDSLPYDVVLNLISFLSGRTRVNLGSTCMKLHRFDRAAGERKFKHIWIDWDKFTIEIHPGRHMSPHRIMFRQNSIEEARATEFFRTASIQSLNILSPANESCNEPLAKFLRNIKYKELNLFYIPKTNIDILSVMMAGRNFE
ncbi:hypothetical protein PFISCL1PPCAC_25764, partial [Pristionchus fissidentatus]